MEVKYAGQQALEAVMNKCREEFAVTNLLTATIPASGWSGSAPYSVAVAVPGILETDAPLVYPDQSAASEAVLAAWACISEIDTADGSITVYAAEAIPTAAIPIFLKVVR